MSFTFLTDRTENQFGCKNPAMTLAEARSEANHCLNCFDAPCIKACPTGINIPQFIKRIGDDNVTGSADAILQSNILGLSCSKVCPVEELCVGACVHNLDKKPPVQIGRLQEYAMNAFYSALPSSSLKLRRTRGLRKTDSVKSNKRVALIGAGPASLSCAAYLTLSGVKTVIYEKNDLPGGLNSTGIAPYKLKLEDSVCEVNFIQSLGVEIKTGVQVGKDIDPKSLQKDFDAIFVGVGLGRDRFVLGGQSIKGVWGAVELISEIKLKKTKALEGVRKAVVVGGGNTALDIVQELAGLGIKDVVLAYRRTEKEMSGYKHELVGARKLGVRLIENVSPKEILSTDKEVVSSVLFESKDTKDLKIETDLVVFATGQAKVDVSLWFEGLKLDSKKCVVVDEKSFQTNLKNIYAGGDCVNGGKEVVNAVYHGREAASHMLKSFGLEAQYGRFKD